VVSEAVQQSLLCGDLSVRGAGHFRWPQSVGQQVGFARMAIYNVIVSELQGIRKSVKLKSPGATQQFTRLQSPPGLAGRLQQLRFE